jgi:HlyD family secretion protein
MPSPRVTIPLLAFAGLAAACGKGDTPDAYGNFEAEEVVVAAETNGQLRRFAVVEGDQLPAGRVVAQIDTVQLALERAQLAATRAATAARRLEAIEQRRAVAVQREIADRSLARTVRLFEAQAATASQRDLAEREARVQQVQGDAAAATIRRIDAELASLDARLAAVDDRLARASVANPVAGTVLATYVRVGEVIAPGQPLYRIAALDTLTLRAYVSGAQLTTVRIGAPVTVRIDGPDASLEALPGRVTWVSARAEFTPTPVQTRDERVELVYAVKVRVANPDGRLKIGMPGDVSFDAPALPAHGATR